jgi:dTDP-6-deoxy-L-talose 4-dehydrogenase (NAD+)
MKILVTGCTGFIGNYVINELLRCGVEVIASSFSKEKAEAASWFHDVTYIQYDIHQVEENLFNKFNQPDALIHLAWYGLPNYNKLIHFESELPAQYHFLKTLILEGLQQINITGTCFEYGMKENKLSENELSNPSNAYALAKDTLRKFLEELQKEYSFTLKWMRLFYMYGNGQNEKSILSQLQRAIRLKEPMFNMSQGEQIRDYLPVEKVAEHIVEVALQNKTTGIINISSNKPIKIIDFVQNYLKENNVTISLNLGFYPYPDYEPFIFWGDNTKLLNLHS